MTDKEKIKEEIERLHELLPVMDGDNVSINYAETICTALEKYIDSLPEEHNEDLDEAAQEYSFNIPTQLEADIIWKRETEQHFKDGAEWHNNQMKEVLQTEYEKGRFDMREEMMKDAVEGEVVYKIGNAEIAPTDVRYKVMSDRVYIPNVKLGDKVQLIIIKPEQQ